MTPFKFIVTVECETQEQANEVITERIGYDEDYGFEYEVDWAPNHDAAFHEEVERRTGAPCPDCEPWEEPE